MKLCFDLDGTISEGRYLPEPRTVHDYLSLQVFDQDVKKYWQDICRQNDVFIITGRSELEATFLVKEWMYNQELSVDWWYAPAIITNPTKGSDSSAVGVWKYNLCKQLGIDLIFDDNPSLYQAWCDDNDPIETTPFPYLVDNPSWEKNQQFKVACDACYRPQSWKEINEIINYRSS